MVSRGETGAVLLAIAGAAAVVLFACRGSNDAPTAGEGATTVAAPTRARVALGRLRVDDLTPIDQRPYAPTGEVLEATLRDSFLKMGLSTEPAVASDWVLTARAQAVYGVQSGEALARTPTAGKAAARWAVKVTLREPGDPVPFETACDGADEGDFDGQPVGLGPAIDAHLKAAAARCAASLQDELGVLTLDAAGLMVAVDDDSPAHRRTAADRLGRMRHRAAAPTLAARLKKETDRETQLRIVGALAELGDERAVPALIAIADPKDRELLHAVVDALSVLGGKDVEAFLDVLSMHDAADVRELITEARARLALRRAP